ncbi:Redoxin [Meira miltonrushii]|uniref:Redoxin n=1 Tax=Meira miltonrushii TaxID=1280837 RepID=A0A316VKV0_9BASI|nr:Redoxin [Meira miltonrushii]PWN36691.1 Redoxin [Meira miltonrushii]
MSSFVGKEIPQATFAEVPYTPALDDPKACAGPPRKVQTHEAFKGKKVVIVAVPGSFTPTCHGNHAPGFVKDAKKFADKGYDVWIIAANDPFVQSAWRTSLGAKDEVHFATDVDLQFSKGIDATVDASAHGLGIRAARYVLIADDLKIKSLDVEASPGEVNVSSAELAYGKL